MPKAKAAPVKRTPAGPTVRRVPARLPTAPPILEPPVPTDGLEDQFIADVAGIFADELRAKLVVGEPLLPTVRSFRQGIPAWTAVAVVFGVRLIVNRALDQALTVLEAEAEARRKAKPTGARRRSAKPVRPTV